jgi:hypothetical protein
MQNVYGVKMLEVSRARDQTESKSTTTADAATNVLRYYAKIFNYFANCRKNNIKISLRRSSYGSKSKSNEPLN